MRISDWSSDVCSSDLCRRRSPSRRKKLPSSPLPRRRQARQSSISMRVSPKPASPPGIQPSMHAPSSAFVGRATRRSEEHTSELQSLMRISYAVFCLKKKTILRAERQHGHHTTTDALVDHTDKTIRSK